MLDALERGAVGNMPAPNFTGSLQACSDFGKRANASAPSSSSIGEFPM